MCFSARYRLEIALKRARYYDNMPDIEFYKNELKDYDELYMADGFAHPELIIYTNQAPYKPILSRWGLIPHWSKSNNYSEFKANTLNAKAENLFEKPSFKFAARQQRCIIPAEGFYEYHHFKGKTYPFYIYQKSGEPLNFAGLWSKWTDKNTGEITNTCTIVTTKANALMAKIHNNPKLKEPRMPVILKDGAEDRWLDKWNGEHDKERLQQLLIPFPENELQAHTVRKLKGKDSPGNVPEANEKFEYPELKF